MSDLVVGPITQLVGASPGTVAEMVEQVLTKLLSSQRETLNKLASSLDSTSETAVFVRAIDSIQTGARLCMDLEEAFVWEADAMSKTAIIERGQRGSVAAGHAAGTLIQVNPRFSRWQIFKAICEEVNSLVGRGLWRMATVDVTYNSAVQGYDLTGVDDILQRPYKILRQQTGPEEYWPEINRFTYSSDLPAAEFASGKAIFLHEGGMPGETLRIWYKAGFSAPSALTDNVTAATGLPAIAHDILVWGAAARLAPVRVVARTDMYSQGDTRRAEEVGATDILRSGLAMAEERDRLVQGEIMRLTRLYPQYI